MKSDLSKQGLYLEFDMDSTHAQKALISSHKEKVTVHADGNGGSCHLCEGPGWCSRPELHLPYRSHIWTSKMMWGDSIQTWSCGDHAKGSLALWIVCIPQAIHNNHSMHCKWYSLLYVVQCWRRFYPRIATQNTMELIVSFIRSESACICSGQITLPLLPNRCSYPGYGHPICLVLLNCSSPKMCGQSPSILPGLRKFPKMPCD